MLPRHTCEMTDGRGNAFVTLRLRLQTMTRDNSEPSVLGKLRNLLAPASWGWGEARGRDLLSPGDSLGPQGNSPSFS